MFSKTEQKVLFPSASFYIWFFLFTRNHVSLTYTWC